MIVKTTPIATLPPEAEIAIQPQTVPDAREPALEIRAPIDGASGYTLPRDHPPWPCDGFSLTARARAFLARARPIVVAVLSFWDQRVRSIETTLGNVSIDQSGSYRLS